MAACVIGEFLAFPFFIGLVMHVGKRFFSFSHLWLPATVCWGTLYLFTLSRLRTFPCPRCGKNFFGGFLGNPRNLLNRTCENCGLKRYEGT